MVYRPDGSQGPATLAECQVAREQFRESLTEVLIEESRGAFEPINAWRQVRAEVLDCAESLGLTIDAVRTDGTVPLAEHFADEAALIVVRRAGAAVVRPTYTGADVAYVARMRDVHGFTPTDSLPPDPRGFCGQHALSPRRGYLDHVRTWFDPSGDPVLTAEPYRDALTGPAFDDELPEWIELDDDETISRAEALVRELADLPLTLDVQPGLWCSDDPEATRLLIFRHDPEAEVLPAEHTRVESDGFGEEWRVTAA